MEAQNTNLTGFVRFPYIPVNPSEEKSYFFNDSLYILFTAIASSFSVTSSDSSKIIMTALMLGNY